MEISDEYQEMGNPGGGVGVAVANMTMPHHRHTPESPLVSIESGSTGDRYKTDDDLSHPEDDLSDPDLQDEESGEELPQQPLQGNNHSSADIGSVTSNNSATPLTHLNSLMGSSPANSFLAKLKLEEELTNKGIPIEALQAAMQSSNFNIPFPFMPPVPCLPPVHHSQSHSHLSVPTNVGGGGGVNASSASSHSSESSQGSARNGVEPRESSNHSQSSNAQANNSFQQHQTICSFEEQFKQLYEVNDDPKRKEFLDDLFSFMQKKGSPINRLPIMAKSVLDLFELYNLVIARGGLVDVINKKLWQEIIKGLHLPSSITSAAFTLRTQYMKYLYPYESEKLRLSTPAELQAAIDGNRREGRRSSYGAFGGSTENMGLSRSHPHTPGSYAQMSPMGLVPGAGVPHLPSQALVNGTAAHTPLSHHGHHPQLPQQGPMAQPLDIGAQMMQYVKMLNKEYGPRSPPSMSHRQGSASPPPSTSPRDSALTALEMSRLSSMWMYGANNPLYSEVSHMQNSVSPHPQSPLQAHTSMSAASPEPQHEALDLGLRSSPTMSSPAGHSPPSSGIPIKRELGMNCTPPCKSKRPCIDEEERSLCDSNPLPLTPGTHIKISNRNDPHNGDNSMVVSIELNGIKYQGVLFAQSAKGDSAASTPSNNNNTKSTRIIS